ncbi:uncharacterized protein LOC125943186 isoform X3 [Dermacentor silvarum]|uniref:uncharacterized protein LOC125943186 isoform X1 n=1 Tax=Dermacentor silvarum TaxID=543639 RepID=UPI0021015093|nr:uncharacterized protein LOC125943186 isoform X1 [Dermacentor silvarum]XP_049517684.1 uncharacterized protein LOC125943186 isoform X2 [Dermacentor silvarum]XP_049517685.1 uncharacterized protein LOC125943186 isoform X3 [Dermacentor silvarum]
MDHGTKKSSTDPEQSSTAGNSSTKILKSSTDSASELAKKQPTAAHDISKGHPAHHKSIAVTSTAKPVQHPSPQSKELAAGGTGLTDKKEAATLEKDMKEAGKDVVDDDDEPAVDPREPLPDRAVIDRRVSMGEVLHTEPPPHFLG